MKQTVCDICKSVIGDEDAEQTLTMAAPEGAGFFYEDVCQACYTAIVRVIDKLQHPRVKLTEKRVKTPPKKKKRKYVRKTAKKEV